MAGGCLGVVVHDLARCGLAGGGVIHAGDDDVGGGSAIKALAGCGARHFFVAFIARALIVVGGHQADSFCRRCSLVVRPAMVPTGRLLFLSCFMKSPERRRKVVSD